MGHPAEERRSTSGHPQLRQKQQLNRDRAYSCGPFHACSGRGGGSAGRRGGQGGAPGGHRGGARGEAAATGPATPPRQTQTSSAVTITAPATTAVTTKAREEVMGTEEEAVAKIKRPATDEPPPPQLSIRRGAALVLQGPLQPMRLFLLTLPRLRVTSRAARTRRRHRARPEAAERPWKWEGRSLGTQEQRQKQ